MSASAATVSSRLLRLFDAEVGQLPRSYWFVWGGTLVNRLGSFVLPMLTIYLTRRRGLSLEDAGAIVSGFGLGSLGGVTLGGVLADRLGRRATMLLGLVLGAASMLALGAAAQYWQLALGAAALGLFGDLYRPASSALIADLVPPEHRLKAFGLLYWAINLGFALGTGVAGFLAESHFTALFIGDAATTLIFAAIIYRFVPEPARHPAPKDGGGSLLTPFLDPVFLPFLILNFLIITVFFQHLVTLPADMASKQLGSSDYGLAIAFNGILIVLLQPLATRLLKGVGRARVLAAGCLLTGLGMGINAFAQALPLFVLSVAVWTLGEILMSPVSSSIIADLSPAHLRGRYQAAFFLTWGLAMVIAPLLGPWIVRASDLPTLWLWCVALGAVCAVGQLLLTGPRRRRMLELGTAVSGLRD
ncbi:MAG: major facilitator family transporter [Myxococcaceae bacterium]|nr:major facilitator family transporter [Myxococcaceae bacterium]